MRVFILTEAGGQSGYGHISRCSALGEELSARGFETEYIINFCRDTGSNFNGDDSAVVPPQSHVLREIQKYTKDAAVRVTDWTDRDSEAITDALSGCLCIIDSYIASEDIVREICQRAGRCLCIDDNNIRRYENCTVVNPALKARDYAADESAGFYSGPEYIILRKPFRKKFNRNLRRDIQTVTISLGGTDVLGLAPEIIKRLADARIKPCGTDNFLGDLKINAVVSRSAAYYGELCMAFASEVNFYSDLDADGMLSLFLESDAVVSAGGQTVNELVQCGTPGIFICVAENQAKNVADAVSLGFGRELSPESAGVEIIDALRRMDYNARAEIVRRMGAYDFSGGVKNIVDRFLRV